MFRIDSDGSVASLPAPAAVGTQAFFTDGNPLTSVPATVVSADWLNAVQEELANAIEGLGGTLSKTNRAQLLAVLKTAIGANSQCQLQFGSATSIKLMPYRGASIAIAGAQYQLPSAGVSIANTGLTASTKYYVYVYNNAGVLTLELSTTGHSTDTTAGNVGNEIKTGDSSRSLVGMIYTDTSTPGQFQSGALLLSWHNRRSIFATKSAAGSTASSAFVELSSANRLPFLAWADEATVILSFGNGNNSTAGSGAKLNLGVDNTTPLGPDAVITSPAVSQSFSIATQATLGGSEGFHYATPLAAQTIGGTASLQVTTSVTVRG